MFKLYKVSLGSKTPVATFTDGELLFKFFIDSGLVYDKNLTRIPDDKLKLGATYYTNATTYVGFVAVRDNTLKSNPKTVSELL